MARWNSCNVILTGADQRQLWHFDSRNGEFVLGREQTVRGQEPLPSNLVAKNWSSLWKPKLNIAWLPPESIFLRVVHLPASSPEEMLSMVELQLEKLSPIPVTQVVWSVEKLPQSAENSQTVIVVMAERKVVEEFLGKLEGQGYLADRLEFPALDVLLATPINEDGAWVYPGTRNGLKTALVVWWYGGILQNVNFLTLSTGEGDTGSLKEQFAQMAWAGELEGWLTGPPKWHLVATGAAATEWQMPLVEELNEPVTVVEPVAMAQLAALTAKRAANPHTKTNLLPPEYAVRYRQQFVDRLWARALLAALGLYMVGVFIYFIALGVLSFRTGRVETQVAQMSNDYTNAVQTKTLYGVLKDRQELKYAALDCWKAVAELLPETVTLDGFNFIDGRKLSLNGTAPKDLVNEVTTFNATLQKAPANNNQPLFDATKGDLPSFNMAPGAATVNWKFTLELKRSDAQ